MSHPLEGRVRAWSPDAAVIDGLEGAALYDRVEFEGGAQGLVTALERMNMGLYSRSRPGCNGLPSFGARIPPSEPGTRSGA